MVGQDAFFQYLPVNEKTSSCGLYVPARPSGHQAGRKVSAVRPTHAVPMRLASGPDAARISAGVHLRGSGEFDRKLPRVEIDGPTLIFCFPRVASARPIPDVGWTERWISFNGDLVSRLFAIGSFEPALAVAKPSDPERLAANYDCIIDARSVRPRQRMTYIMIGRKAMRIARLRHGQRRFERTDSSSRDTDRR